jgi:hypothetical protein
MEVHVVPAVLVQCRRYGYPNQGASCIGRGGAWLTATAAGSLAVGELVQRDVHVLA